MDVIKTALVCTVHTKQCKDRGRILELAGEHHCLGRSYSSHGPDPWRLRETPAVIWALWDKFGIADSDFIGWWSEKCIAAVDNSDVRSSAFINSDGSVMICFASCADDDVIVALAVDWEALGFDSAVLFRAPTMGGIQTETFFNITSETIPVAGNKGWILLAAHS